MLWAWLLLSARADDADPVLVALDQELARTLPAWRDDGLYFLSYRVADFRTVEVIARRGALSRTSDTRNRILDVSARVGSYAVDSSHKLKGEDAFDLDFHVPDALPVDASVPALRSAIWTTTSREIDSAVEHWTRVLTNREVKVEDRDKSADFTVLGPTVDIRPRADVTLDVDAWSRTLRAISERLDESALVTRSSAEVRAVAVNEYFVSSEGTRLRQPRTWYRVSVQASTVAPDGMDISLYRWRDFASPAALPDEATLGRWADELVGRALALHDAPEGEPYGGPLLLQGKAAAVFVHEVIGHRVEGHRQKDDDEGQTFKKQIGQTLLPTAITIVDDPTLAAANGIDLNGHYVYDQEGVAAAPALIVDHGVFKGFLMSRSPIEGFSTSNGHGRAQAGRNPVARMANTVLTTTDPKSLDELREMLRREARAQGREYGLVVDEIEGGFTMTGRTTPNAFNVRATYAWRVYVDGRPDDLVRGVDLIGTPLVALTNVVAAGNNPDVFNGFCGAESGSVPNSAVAPPVLFRRLEVQKKETGSDKPPLLPKPGTQRGDT